MDKIPAIPVIANPVSNEKTGKQNVYSNKAKTKKLQGREIKIAAELDAHIISLYGFLS